MLLLLLDVITLEAKLQKLYYELMHTHGASMQSINQVQTVLETLDEAQERQREAIKMKMKMMMMTMMMKMMSMMMMK
eukprot:11379084-Karenia_brevis.AAC.1